MAVRSLQKVDQYVKGPGAFRFLLALLVVFHHATKYIKLGEFAVYVFFMLSGYWIFKMYKEKYSQLNAPYLSFIISRWFRIYPTYIVNLFLLFLFVFLFKWSPSLLQAYVTGGHTQFWVSSLLLLGYNQLPDLSKFLVPAWSLDIELQFYLVFPLMFLSLRRFSPLLTCVFILIIEVLLTTLFYNVFKNSFLPGMHFFLIGIVVCITDFKPSKRLVIASFLLFAILLSINYLHPVLRANMFKSNRDLVWMGLNYHWLFSTLLAMSVIPIVAKSVRQVSIPADRFLGNLSYNVYLFHWVLLVPYNYLFSSLPFLLRLPYFLIYLCLTLIGASLMNKCIDKPIEIFRANWLKKKHYRGNMKEPAGFNEDCNKERPIEYEHKNSAA